VAERTEIAWCDSTFNPWIGCTRVSPGCDNCYAAAQDKFRGWTPEGWGGPRRRTSEANWRQPLRWNAETFVRCDACGWRGALAAAGRTGACPGCSAVDRYTPVRRRVFCASLADVFDNQVPDQWRANLFDLIRRCPNLDFLLLTKRPQNIIRMVRESGAIAGNGTRYLPDNAWLGTTCEDQARADHNIQHLLRTIGELGARVTFISVEPMLGPVEIFSTMTGELLHTSGNDYEPGWISWVIVGGESGCGARPMHPEWAKSLRDQCAAAGVPFLFKQWGEFLPRSADAEDPSIADVPESRLFWSDGSQWCRQDGQRAGVDLVARVGKKAAGRLLDGVTHDGFPEAR